MYIKKVDQIVSKNGDKGESKNFNNETYKKNDVLFEVMGVIDELSSFLGLSYHFTGYEYIKEIQKKLQNVNSAIATSPDSDLSKKIDKVTEHDVLFLENEMQNILDQKPIEAKFVLPGSERSKNGAFFDYARTLARKCERRLVDFKGNHRRNDLENELKYLNRLSDYLFVLAGIL
jgi:cob(I)alamin adenosyltransferase